MQRLRLQRRRPRGRVHCRAGRLPQHSPRKAEARAYGFFTVSSVPDGDTFVYNIGQGSKFDEAQTVYLPAGSYVGTFSAYSLFDTNVTVANTPARVDLKATFDVAGSQTVAPVGKASRYVALPGSRSCATDSLDATITPKSKRAAKIKKITFYVNDKRAKKVRKPAKGSVVKVPVVDDVAAELRAVVVEVKGRTASRARSRRSPRATCPAVGAPGCRRLDRRWSHG